MQDRKHSQLSEELQFVYEQLRRRRTLPEFFSGLLHNVKPILESINNSEGTKLRLFRLGVRRGHYREKFGQAGYACPAH